MTDNFCHVFSLSSFQNDKNRRFIRKKLDFFRLLCETECMDRRVERQFIDEYVDRNYPNGLAKLSFVSGVPAPCICKIRNGHVPKKQGSRLKLAAALGLEEDVLFPFVEEKKEAS